MTGDDGTAHVGLAVGTSVHAGANALGVKRLFNRRSGTQISTVEDHPSSPRAEEDEIEGPPSETSMVHAAPPALEAESACETDELDSSDRDSSSNHEDATYLPSKSEEDGAQVSAANDTDSIPAHPVESIGENAVQPSLGTGYEGLQPQTIPLKSAAEGVDDSADPRTDQSLSAENTTASAEVAAAAENASDDSAIFDKEKQEPDERFAQKLREITSHHIGSFSSGPLNRTKTATHGLEINPNVLKTKISWKDLAGTANLEKLRALEMERAKIRDRAIGEAPETTIGSSSLEKFEELERERERIRSEGIPEVQDVRPVDLTKFEALEKEREMIMSKGIVDGPETTIGTSKLSKLEELERKRESIQSGKVQDVVDTGFSVNLSKLEELEKQREKVRAQGNQEGTEISMRVNLQRLEPNVSCPETTPPLPKMAPIAFPLELFPIIVRCSHPFWGRRIRCLNGALSRIITSSDLAWGEAGWRLRCRGKECCLIWAAKKGHLEVVRWVLQSGADVHAKDDAALRAAAGKGHLDVVRLLLASGANVHAHHDMAFLSAVKEGHLEMVRLLWESGDGVQAVTSHIALLAAASRGRLEMVSLLLDFGAGRHTLDQAFIRAAEEGHVEVVRLLLHAGANVHSDNDSAFHRAAQKGRLPVVRLLLTSGVDMDIAWRIAASHGYLDVVRLLLTSGTDVHADNDIAFRVAAQNGHLEVAQLLLDNGANVHADNDIALRYAASMGHLGVVHLLLENKADVHAVNDIALHLSALNGHLEVVQLLLDNEADVHADNDWALRYAAPKGHLEYRPLVVERWGERARRQ
ncbi:hypothetical protein HK104_001014 [Borealophlyctis nickersoniae]|nr:hypothetical protein HK104_001014 [Borealophlyctis nickersoniae]